MPREEAQVVSDATHGYEPRDLSLKAVILTAGGLLALLVSAVLLLKPLFGYQSGDHVLVESVLRPLTASYDLKKRFPKPRLEPRAKEDLETLRAEEDRILNHYGWEDRARGLVRAPIAVAIDKLLQRGLPTRKGSNEK